MFLANKLANFTPTMVMEKNNTNNNISDAIMFGSRDGTLNKKFNEVDLQFMGP